jgi:hypothetical protein
MHMKKNIILLVIGLLMFVTVGYSQKKGVAPTWPGVAYSYVKVYLYNLDNQLYGNYKPVKNGKLDATMVGPGVEFTAAQTTELLTILNGDTRVLNAGLSGCYEPHHAFVFYDDKDNIVASSDVCFLCQGIRFYPAKKYFKELTSHSATATKAAEKQLELIQSLVEKTEIPVFKKSIDYIKYGEGLTKNETLSVQNDSIFKNLIRPFKNLKALLKVIPNGNSIIIDSAKRYVAGGDKVMFYFLTSENLNIECSTYNNGQLWITMVKAEKKPCNILNRIEILDRKYEIYERLLPDIKSYPYEKKIYVYYDTENITFGFDEDHFINFIHYNSHH